MNNILEYLKWRGDILLTQVPYGEVDAYILAKTVEPDFTGIVPSSGAGIPLSEAFAQFFAQVDANPDYFGELYQPILSDALHRIAESARFKDIILSDYTRRFDEDAAEQFSALTLSLPNGETVVVFRGTDDTIAGWKENFLMAVESPILAQADALAYLGSAATKFEGPFSVIGHSKGGNLAMFAASRVSRDIQDRITQVYNFDGPGFFPEFWQEASTKRIQGRIHSYLPQDSIVGTLFTNPGPIALCKSLKLGPVAHEAMNWEVMGASFLREECFTAFSTEFARLINNRMQSLSKEEIRAILDDFFGILTSTGAVTLTDLAKQPAASRLSILKAISESETIKKFGKDIVSFLFQDKMLLSRLLKRGITAEEKEALDSNGESTS